MGHRQTPLLACLAVALTARTVAAWCAGDCDHDRKVTVDEVVALVTATLTDGSVAGCAAGDANGDQRFAIDDIVAAVDSALNGCPPDVSSSWRQDQAAIASSTCAAAVNSSIAKEIAAGGFNCFYDLADYGGQVTLAETCNPGEVNWVKGSADATGRVTAWFSAEATQDNCTVTIDQSISVVVTASPAGVTDNITYQFSPGCDWANCRMVLQTRWSKLTGPVRRELGSAIPYSTNGMRTGKTVIGDLNGDGLNDVMLQPNLLYLQTASGELSLATTITSDIEVRGVAIGDLNGDGRADLALSGMTLVGLSGYLGRLVVFLQDPQSGSLLPAHEYEVSSNVVGDLAIGDLNGDGRNDVAVEADWVVGPGQGRLAVFDQQGGGTLGPEVTYDQVPVKFTGEIYIADVSGDGRNDIIVQAGPLRIAVVKQAPDGALSETPDLYAVDSPDWSSFDAFAVGDVNSDGRRDVVVDISSNTSYRHVFLQTPAGGMAASNPIPLSAAPFGIEIADIDGDGLNDILGEASNSVFVAYQTAAHTFASLVPYYYPTISYGGAFEHRALAVGDVTGDGWPDAVVTWAGEGLYVLPGVVKHW